ncbi:MAG: hypothetical protein AAB257_07510, partial [Nitrospinota bacterium]
MHKYRPQIFSALKLLLFLFIIQITLPACEDTSSKSSKLSLTDSEYNKIISDRWMGIYFKGSKLGFTNSTIYEGKDGYKIVSKAIIKMKAFGDTQNTSFSQECYLTKDLKTEGFKSLYEIASHRQDISGIVEGNKLYMNITSGGA